MKILPRDSILASFKVEKKGDLYPAPSLSLDFPYSEGKTYQIEKWLTIARRAYCYGVKTHITIDGEIKESDWEDPVTLFFSPQGNPMEIDPVRFYFAHDHENLFIAAYCKESNMDSMVATVIEHDGPVYGEDCVGYFIQPNIDLGTVYQIYLNSLETVFDQKILKTPEGKIDVDREWNGMYEVAAIRGNDYWSIEARIPLNQFEFAPGEEWGINFRRKQKRYNSTADWQVPISYDPSTYGFLIMK